MRVRGIYLASVLVSASVAFLHAQHYVVPADDFVVTDGSVNTVFCNGESVYIGGAFNRVGPFTGASAEVSSDTGDLIPGIPKIHGHVSCAVDDGNGGWFIGGLFNRVGDAQVTNFVHVLANKNIDTNWNLNPNGRVYTLLTRGNQIILGGAFTTIADQPRPGLAAFDRASGQLSTWTASAGSVFSMATWSNTLYFADGALRAVDVETGVSKAILYTDGQLLHVERVYAVAVLSNTVFASGEFRWVQSQGATHGTILAVDCNSNTLLPWDTGQWSFSYALAATNNTVYVGGQTFLQAYDATTAQPTSWSPSVSGFGAMGRSVSFLKIHGNTMFAGGEFTELGGLDRKRAGALDLVTGQVLPWNPGANGRVHTIVPVADRIFVGGGFSGISGQARTNAAKIHGATGQVDSWNPSPNGTINSIAVVSNTVFLGGSFTSVNGVARTNCAAVDHVDATVREWNLNANQPVSSLAVCESTVYIGGSFSNIANLSRTYLAACDSSGNLTSWSPQPNSRVTLLTASTNTIYAAGLFRTIDGSSRTNLAAISTNGTLTPWNPQLGGFASGESLVMAMSIKSNVLYASGQFSSVNGQPRNKIAAIDLATGLATSWIPVLPKNPVRGFALTTDDNNVYWQADFSGGFTGCRLLCISMATGLTNSWTSDEGYSWQTLVIREGELYAGSPKSDFELGEVRWRSVAAFQAHAQFTSTRYVDNGPTSQFITTLKVAPGLPLTLQRSTQMSAWTNLLTIVPSQELLTLTNSAEDPYLSFYRTVVP